MGARRRRFMAMALAFALLVPSAAMGQGLDPEQLALARLARDDGPAARFELAYTRTFTLPVSGRPLWAGKFVDAASGTVDAVYVDGDTALDPAELAALEQAEWEALSPFERKADPALRQARRGSRSSVPLSLWLDADTTLAIDRVFAAHPTVARRGDRPDVADPILARQLRQELHDARASVYAEAEARAADLIRWLGGLPGYGSSAAPLLFAEVPVVALDRLAERPEVQAMGGADTGGWGETMAYAGPTVRSDWAYGQGYRGAGVRVADVEYYNIRETGDLAGKVVAFHNTQSSSPAYDTVGLDHPTWVGGAIAGQSSTYRGTAPGASLVSSSTGGQAAGLARDQDVIAATDWAIGSGGADVVNTSLGQDTATGREQARRYFDSIVAEDMRVSVSSAGNYSTFGSWNIVSPGTGWNVLTVGGTDDGNTGSWSNDKMWATSTDGSCYADPTGTAWNPHGDFNKPNVSAPAVTVQTANGQSATGTSIASPIVAGVVAELVGRNATFLNWPEIPRALVMAGAIHHSPMPSGGQSAAREGVGTVDAEWSNRILNGSAYGGYIYGSLGPGGTTASLSVAKGQNVRIALVWDSHTSGSNLSKTDTLTADLDLRATFPDGAARSSLTFDNSYEFIEYTPTAGGTVTIQVGATRFDASNEDFALAWAKWPTVTEDLAPPSAPTNLVANATGSSSVALSWSASTDDVGVAGYRISRDGVQVASVGGTSWTDTGLSPGTTYGYSVVAFDAAGHTSAAATASATTDPPDTEAPSAPTNLGAIVLKSGTTKLSWLASTDNVAVSGYRVFRNGTLYVTTTGTSLSIRKQRGTFSYEVIAFDQAGNLSEPSNTVTVTVR
jgi:hypothetical protein